MAAPIEMDYTNRDFQSIRSFLVNAAQTFMPDWTTAGEPADFGTLLLELYAYVGDGMHYYIDRVAAEPFLATAVRRQSLLAIADLLGYVPIAQQAATTFVQFSLDDAAYLSESVDIPVYTVVQTAAPRDELAIFFETAGVLTLGGPSGPRSGVVPAIEGRSITGEFVGISNGAPLQDFMLLNAGIIERTANVLVTEADGVTYPWDFVDRLTDAQPDASVYATVVDENLYTHVRFGDAVSGRIPPVNASIYADYRYGRGSAGNVGAGVVAVISDPIPGVSVINTLPGSGGSDPESLESMRFSIPRASRARDRAVTLEDFAALALQVPGVAKATSYGLYYTLIHVRIAPVGGGDPSADLKTRVTGYLEERMLVGASVVVENPEWLDAEVTMEVVVQPAYGQASVRQGVEDAILALFDFSRVQFGTRISIGEVFRAAVDVTGVDYIDLTNMRVKPLISAPPAVGDIVPTEIQLVRLVPADLVVTATGGLT